MKITGGEQVSHPYILMTPSYGSPRTKGYTPKPVVEFLKTNHEHMVGVIASGNTNFGEDYCKAGHNISRRFQVPLLWRIDLRGNVEDIDTIDRGIAEHWEQLVEIKEALNGH